MDVRLREADPLAVDSRDLWLCAGDPRGYITVADHSTISAAASPNAASRART